MFRLLLILIDIQYVYFVKKLFTLNIYTLLILQLKNYNFNFIIISFYHRHCPVIIRQEVMLDLVHRIRHYLHLILLDQMG